MKIIKKIFIGLGLGILLLLVIALFVKKEYSIKKEVVINKPNEEVFHYIKSLRNQEQYSKWVMADPGMKKSFRGTDGTTGFVYAWDSEDNQVGKGEQEIKNITEGSRVDWEIRFKKPMEGKADSYMSTENLSASQTKVKWSFNSKMKYPLNLILLFVDMDDVLGKDMEASLQNLKTVVEKQPSSTL